jgi:protein arginine kinase activator
VNERRCEECHEREAVIHLHRQQGDVTVVLHLCERCAAEKGVETSATLSKTAVGGFLASMGTGLSPVTACPGCGATLSDFREAGRLGCAECYRAFEGSLRDLLRRLHGSSRHIGKRFLRSGAEPAPALEDTRQLRDQLKRAVELEDFELAAELRDRLRTLEGEAT